MLLTPADLRALTGYQQTARQAAWLTGQGIRYRQNREGLAVTWADVNGNAQPRQTGPNLAAARG